MKISKHDFTGTRHVYSFTLLQLLKNKANIVSLIIMFLFAAFGVPLMALTGNSETEIGMRRSEISAVYVLNETVYPIDMTQDESAKEEGIIGFYQNTKFSETDQSAAQAAGVLEDSEIYVSIKEAAEGFLQIELYKTENSVIQGEDIMRLEEYIRSLLEEARYQALGATKEQTAMLMSSVYGDVMSASQYEDKAGQEFESQFGIQLAYSIVVMIMSVFAISYIVRTVVEEKASRLVELLMVSMKPFALIVGKILASMTYVCLLFAVMIAGFLLSLLGTSVFFPETVDILTQSISSAAENLTFSSITIVIILISLLLGYLTFSIIAGLAGTGCTETEDMQGATMFPTLVVMGGYFVACIVSAFESAAANHAVSLIPILSVFCAPAQYLLGNISLPVLLLSWLLQIALIVALVLFAAKIYRDLLMHRGKRVKFVTMISMAFHRKKAVSKKGGSSHER